MLNTDELMDCDLMDQQAAVIREALEDPGSFEALLVMSHHAVWTAFLEKQGLAQAANARHSIWVNGCTGDSISFELSVWPQLEAVAQAGKQVTVIAGDFGQRVSAFAHFQAENIRFLGSGLDIHKGMEADSILLLTWHEEQGDLTWSFDPILSFISQY